MYRQKHLVFTFFVNFINFRSCQQFSTSRTTRKAPWKDRGHGEGLSDGCRGIGVSATLEVEDEDDLEEEEGGGVSNDCVISDQ